MLQSNGNMRLEGNQNKPETSASQPRVTEGRSKTEDPPTDTRPQPSIETDFESWISSHSRPYPDQSPSSTSPPNRPLSTNVSKKLLTIRDDCGLR